MVKRGWYLPGLLEVIDTCSIAATTAITTNRLIALHHFQCGSFVGRKKNRHKFYLEYHEHKSVLICFCK